MTNEIKLHIGYVGKTRAGDRVEIISEDGHDSRWPFVCNNDLTYTLEGSQSYWGEVKGVDIVGPWEEPVMTDEVNKYNDGKWHGWNGGDCPVHPKSEVKTCHLALGAPTINELSHSAGDQDWENVVAFHVTKVWEEPKEPREFWITGRGSFGEVWSECPEGRSGFIHVKEVLND